MVKTTIFIDEELLEEAIHASRAHSKREAVEKGLSLLVREYNRSALRDELGTFELDLTVKELERLRNET
jgi:Arc/MetJ family transcription regulator